MTLSKPYKHHDKWRVRIRSAEGWTWGPSATTPEEAVAAAQATLDVSVQELPGKPVQAPARTSPAAIDPVRIDGVRLDGPHEHHGGWRYRVIRGPDRRWAPVGSTEAQALRLAQRMVKLYAAGGSVSIRDAVEAFLVGKARAGIRPITIDGYRRSLVRFFAGEIDRPLGWLSASRGQQIYDRLRLAVDRRGRPYSVATHRFALTVVKLWAAWAVDRGLLREDPVSKVRGVGTSSRGKAQLTIDEARRLYSVCMTRAGEGDAGALATLLAVSLGLRASEIVTRTARDLDDGGRVLRVGDNAELGFRTKSRTSGRALRLPPDLQSVLGHHATGKQPNDLLFHNRWGRSHLRQWVGASTRRMCREAGVPRVCPHGLRGVSATAAAAAGALPEMVAQMLGHSGPSVTLGHYIRPGTVEAAQLERGHRTLTGEI